MKICNTCKANKVCNHDIYGFENCNNYIPEADVKQLQWISTKEKSPSKDGEYLVVVQTYHLTFIKMLKYSKNLSKVDRYDLGDRKCAGWYFYDSEYGFCEYGSKDITHWMPLPDLPDKIKNDT